MGNEEVHGTTGAIHSCHPSGLIMHRGQPRGNLADAVKTVVLYAYTGVHARLDPTYVRTYVRRYVSKVKASVFSAPGNTVNVNSMSYGRKKNGRAGGKDGRYR